MSTKQKLIAAIKKKDQAIQLLTVVIKAMRQFREAKSRKGESAVLEALENKLQ